jgi:glycosyltransferase involved in cell wall biosynthesis
MHEAWLFPVLGGVGALAALAWCALHGLGAYALARVPRLPPAPPEDAAPPSLSVIVPACDEADTLEPALRSLLAQDYPGLEIVLVDDRSTDGTGAVVDLLAAADPRVKAVHVRELPPGWLGKVNALRRGAELATGRYLLFTDADVHFAPGALHRALAFAVAHRLEHLTLIPRLRCTSLLQGALMNAFFAGYVRRTLGRALGEAPTPFGFGAFNLVDRAAFEATEGFAWLRMDVLDDIALGALMQGAGRRAGLATATDALEVLWYPTARDAVRGFGKNMFGGLAGYRPGVAAAMVLASLWLGVGPALAAFGTGVWYAGALAAALGALGVESWVLHRRFTLPLGASLLAPLTHLLGAWAMTRSAWVCWRAGGVRWRGTFYPLAELRAGRRVSFP